MMGVGIMKGMEMGIPEVVHLLSFPSLSVLSWIFCVGML